MNSNWRWANWLYFHAGAVLPDGTTLNLPADNDLPLPIDIPADTRNALVVLALPVRRHGIPETGNEMTLDNFARYRTHDMEVRDSNGQDNMALMQVGKLRLRLALEAEVVNAYTCLGIARVVERQPDNRVVLDPEYCVPCLDFKSRPTFGGVCR